MLQKTEAVMLKNILYQESSSIVSLYTRDFGLKSYIIKGGRKPTAKIRSSIFQPLQLLDLVTSHNPKSTLDFIRECVVLADLTLLREDIVKMSLVFFLTEIINLSLKEENPNAEIYDFIKNSVLYINNEESKHLRDFHLYFLYHFATMLGFEPMNNYDNLTPYFNITKGTFISDLDAQTLNVADSLLLHNYFTAAKTNEYIPFTNRAENRKKLITLMVSFYESHITAGRKISSHLMLSEII